jgi:membrane peptidoglycan carboxypeptidase
VLTQDRTISRKMAEILLSLKVEHRLSKEELLEAYLNNVYWGHGVYGIAGRAAHFPRYDNVREIPYTLCET